MSSVVATSSSLAVRSARTSYFNRSIIFFLSVPKNTLLQCEGGMMRMLEEIGVNRVFS